MSAGPLFLPLSKIFLPRPDEPIQIRRFMRQEEWPRRSFTAPNKSSDALHDFSHVLSRWFAIVEPRANGDGTEKVSGTCDPVPLD